MPRIWDAMLMAAAYFPLPDQARMICNALLDVMRETPAVYAAFATCEEDLRGAEVRITYRFGPPDSASDLNPLFVPHFKNGSRS